MDECDEPSAFVGCPVGPECCVVLEGGCFGFVCEFCFLDACYVNVVGVHEMLDLVLGVADPICVEL